MNLPKKENWITIKDLIDYSKRSYNSMELKLVSREHDLKRGISPEGVNRPGMGLFGFFDFFAYERIQIFGRGESALIKKLEAGNQLHSLEALFEYQIPACIFSNGYFPPQPLIEMAAAKHIPMIVSDLPTSDIIQRLQNYIFLSMAPKVVMQGVLMEVFGMGILIEGERGVGKSECALELIERGHRFIADDVVDIHLVENSHLVGTGSKIIAHHMEINGIGLINIAHLFGVSSIRDEKTIDFVVHLEQMKKDHHYERTGFDSQYAEILGIKIPKLLIPIQPGTNIPILVETTAMNQRLKKFGYNTAKEFNKKLSHLIEQGVNT